MLLGHAHPADDSAADAEVSGGEPSATVLAVSKHPVFANVPAECVKEICRAGVSRKFAPGEFLSREDDAAEHWFLLLKGSVRAFCAAPTGQEVTVQLFGAPAAWAEDQLLNERRYSESCIAIDRCLVLQVPKKEFLRIIWKYPELMMNVLREATARLFVANQAERAMAFGAISERLAHLLMSYVRMYGVPVEGGCMIRVSISQDALASDLGVALKSVSRAFKELITDGVLEKRGTNYVVKKLDALKAMAPQPGLDWVSGRRVG